MSSGLPECVSDFFVGTHWVCLLRTHSVTIAYCQCVSSGQSSSSVFQIRKFRVGQEWNWHGFSGLQPTFYMSQTSWRDQACPCSDNNNNNKNNYHLSLLDTNQILSSCYPPLLSPYCSSVGVLCPVVSNPKEIRECMPLTVVMHH